MSTRGKTPKCKKCGEWVDKSLNQFTKKSSGYYHNECIAEDEIIEQHRRELIDYIMEIYNINAPTGWMFNQIKALKEQGYKYKGIELTLRYITEKENIQLLDASEAGIGIVEFYYLKAGKYYAQLEKLRESLEHIDIFVKPDTIVLERKQKSKPKLINIEEL